MNTAIEAVGLMVVIFWPPASIFFTFCYMRKLLKKEDAPPRRWIPFVTVCVWVVVLCSLPAWIEEEIRKGPNALLGAK